MTLEEAQQKARENYFNAYPFKAKLHDKGMKDFILDQIVKDTWEAGYYEGYTDRVKLNKAIKRAVKKLVNE